MSIPADESDRTGLLQRPRNVAGSQSQKSNALLQGAAWGKSR